MSSGLPYLAITLEPGSKREIPRRLLSAEPVLAWGLDCCALNVPASTANPAKIAITRRFLFNVRDLKNRTALFKESGRTRSPKRLQPGAGGPGLVLSLA